jgi:excisionase family DNA binding protein
MPTPGSHPPVLLTAKQAAEYLSLSAGTVYELCRAKKIRHHRMGVDGGTIRIPQDACEEYLLDCTQEPQAESPPLPQLKPKRRSKMSEAERVGLLYMDIPDRMRA